MIICLVKIIVSKFVYEKNDEKKGEKRNSTFGCRMEKRRKLNFCIQKENENSAIFDQIFGLSKTFLTEIGI